MPWSRCVSWDKEAHWKLFIFIEQKSIASSYIISWCGNILHVMNLHTHSQIQSNPDSGHLVSHSIKLWSCCATSGGLLLFVFVCVRQRQSGFCSSTIALRAPLPQVPHWEGSGGGEDGLARAGSEESSRNTPVMMRHSGGLRSPNCWSATSASSMSAEQLESQFVGLFLAFFHISLLIFFLSIHTHF